MSGPELNPCRYCGGEAKIRYDALPFGDQPMQADTSMALIECSRSNCVGQKGYRSTAIAIAAWNTHAPVDHAAYNRGYEDCLYSAAPTVQEEDTAETQRRQLLAWCDARQSDVMGCLELTAKEEATAIGWIDNFRAALRKEG